MPDNNRKTENNIYRVHFQYTEVDMLKLNWDSINAVLSEVVGDTINELSWIEISKNSSLYGESIVNSLIVQGNRFIFF